jgi:hypothetical protein
VKDTTNTNERIEREGRPKVTQLLVAVELRDYFAAAVLQGIYSNAREDYAATTKEDRAVEAYIVADCMLKAREVNQ